MQLTVSLGILVADNISLVHLSWVLPDLLDVHAGYAG
jgi:hypothetical protein